MNGADKQGKILRFAHNFMPGLEVFTHYDRSWLRSDLGAGLSVAAIALPVGIAYADLAGVPAVFGMYSAIFPLLAYALFGSSRQLMTGPDAATCIIVAASLGPLAGGDPGRYLALMVVLTLMTGILYVAAGYARLGFIANFLSLPILTGYLNGIALVSFTSGVLTAKSFARRNRYEIDANQELIAFGACNVASGLAQGFPVTGADSRTAVNNAMGGKTQLVGVVAAGSMLLVLFFLTQPLGYVPTAALAAVIMVSAVGLFDYAELRSLYEISHRELLLSAGTTLGVLILGVLPGVLLAVALSLFWLLTVVSRPQDGVLGRVQGIKGFHNIADFPEATTMPGLILYRFEANLVFFNTDYFRDRVRAVIAASETPVEWVVIDASSINVVDVTSLHKIDELREELAAQGIVLATARAKRNLWKFFNRDWGVKRRELYAKYRFDTIKSAVRAFNNRASEGVSPEPDSSRVELRSGETLD